MKFATLAIFISFSYYLVNGFINLKANSLDTRKLSNIYCSQNVQDPECTENGESKADSGIVGKGGSFSTYE